MRIEGNARYGRGAADERIIEYLSHGRCRINFGREEKDLQEENGKVRLEFASYKTKYNDMLL